jgi:hypothetical protein
MFAANFVQFPAEFGQADPQTRVSNCMHQPSRFLVSALRLCRDALSQPLIPGIHFRKLISPPQAAIDLVVNKRYQLLVGLGA